VTAAAVITGELIRCHGLTVTHGEGMTAVQALVGVDFDVSTGERVALLGPSGSGKTTLLHALGGLISPASGTVSWHGSELADLDRRAREQRAGQRIAYVFQGANLLPNLDVGENIEFAILVAGYPGQTPNAGSEKGTGATESAEDFLGLVGLEAKARALPADLSGGEQQRVAIARALAQQPELLLCDEPTGHLDSDTGSRVLDLIDAARELSGFATVTATHDPAVASRADRTIELADGMIRTGGPA
jgi:putative ABC transport system ATP-binding protein